MNSYIKNILLFGLSVLLIFTPVARGAVRIWSTSLVLFAEASLIFLWLWRANNSGHYSFKRTKLDYPVIIFAILATISFVLSIYKHDSFYALIKLFGYIGVYYVVVNEFDHQMRTWSLRLIVLMGVGLSCFGLLQYFGMICHSWWFPQGFLASTYVNHNHFAGYLELVIPLTIGFMLKGNWRNADTGEDKIIWNIFLLPALAVMIVAFVLAQSRGAWLALLTSVFVIGTVCINRIQFSRKNIIVLILAVIVTASLLYFGKDVISERLDSITEIEAGDASAQTRLLIWKGTVNLIVHNPLIGCGIGDFIWAFPCFRPEGLNVTANFAHNDYLEMAAEMGVLAPVIFVYIIVVIIISAIKRGRMDPLRIGCAAGMLSLSLHGLVDFNFHIPANMLLFTVYAAIIMSTSREYEERR